MSTANALEKMDREEMGNAILKILVDQSSEKNPMSCAMIARAINNNSNGDGDAKIVGHAFKKLRKKLCKKIRKQSANKMIFNYAYKGGGNVAYWWI